MQPRQQGVNRIGFIIIGSVLVCFYGALGATPGKTDAQTHAKTDASLRYIFTSTPRYNAIAWLEGRDRFPLGAKLIAVERGTVRLLAPDFYASADAAVSYDATRVLFSGKRTASDHWQIWEVDLKGGEPRQLTPSGTDCFRPLYLPGPENGFVCSNGHGLEISGKPISFAPGRYLTDDVLRDGRILFEISRGSGRELYTVYPDGTGVESLRCDHGPDRGDARQLASGGYIFISDDRLAGITSALAHQVDLPQPDHQLVGPIAEISNTEWLISLRKNEKLGLFVWNRASNQTTLLETPADASAVQPVIIAPRTPPKQFPSALLPTRAAGNLLCLNARALRNWRNEPNIRAVKVYTQAGLLGQTEVEPDGSFYIQVPPDLPIRMETVDATGKVVAAEHNWFWMRPAEQRICVGCHTGPERAPENKVPDILLKTIVPLKMLEVQQP